MIKKKNQNQVIKVLLKIKVQTIRNTVIEQGQKADNPVHTRNKYKCPAITGHL
jgi:hypothetical protein